jgi:hypothetical protein
MLSCIGLSLPERFVSSEFSTGIVHLFLICPMHATCPSYLFLLDLYIIIISGERELK